MASQPIVIPSAAYAAMFDDLTTARAAAVTLQRVFREGGEQEFKARLSQLYAVYLAGKPRASRPAKSKPAAARTSDLFENDDHAWNKIREDYRDSMRECSGPSLVLVDRLPGDTRQPLDLFLSTFRPDAHPIGNAFHAYRVSDEATYSTQGLSSEAYALAELKPYIRALHSRYIPWAVGQKRRRGRHTGHRGFENWSSSTFELRAKCDPWVYAAIVADISLEYMVRSYGASNAAVLHGNSQRVYDMWIKGPFTETCPAITPVLDEDIDADAERAAREKPHAPG